MYFIVFFHIFRYIDHYSKWLPRNHYYICDVELTLTQAIGSGDPKNLQLISDEQLQRKIDLCQKLLKLFNVLAAGKIIESISIKSIFKAILEFKNLKINSIAIFQLNLVA